MIQLRVLVAVVQVVIELRQEPLAAEQEQSLCFQQQS
jgi:hypothetical protein